MRILIADDHALLRDAVKGLIERSDLQADVLVAGTLPEAIRLAAGLQPPADLILLDLDMPGMNGLSGIVEMKKVRPAVPIAIVSAFATPANALGAIDAGAAAFIPKTMGAKAMLVALRLVLAGERYVPADLMKEARAAAEKSEQAKPLASITVREGRILELLREGKANKEIARALGIEEYTVKYHIRGILRKLGARNRTQAVRIAIEDGYFVQPPR